MGRAGAHDLRDVVALGVAHDFLEHGGLRHRLELGHLGDHRAGVVREARVGRAVAHDPDHRGHAGRAVDRRLGEGDEPEAADLAAGGLAGPRRRRGGEEGRGERGEAQRSSRHLPPPARTDA